MSEVPVFNAKDNARFLLNYAKGHHAGAFATPLAKDLNPDNCASLHNGARRTVYVHKRLTRTSTRKDFTGRKYTLPVGATVITHLARTFDAPVPDLASFDYVYAYSEDRTLTAGMLAQGREPVAFAVSASSELVACWGRAGAGHDYQPVDLMTVGEVTDPLPDHDPKVLRAEVVALNEWHDDFPFYSDGSWSALNLRGFYPDDPTRGIKPAEMPRKWKDDNAADLARQCDWTALADRCPTIVNLVKQVAWWPNLERVRLLRMAGRDGQGGVLRRHTDITDRNAGTQDGHIARFHIPIVTHPDIKLSAWNIWGSRRNLHLRENGCYYLDARKPHAVTNPTGVDRVHLVVDVVASPTVRQHIAQANELVA